MKPSNSVTLQLTLSNFNSNKSQNIKCPQINPQINPKDNQNNPSLTIPPKTNRCDRHLKLHNVIAQLNQLINHTIMHYINT